MILFFYGEDTFRLKQKLKALKEKFISASLGDTNLTVLDGEKLTYDALVRQILAMPFLSRTRLVIVENILKDGKQEVLEKIPEALAKVPQSTVLVFVEEGVPDRRTTLFKKLNKLAQVQEFKLLEPEPLRRWINREIDNRKSRIEPQAVWRLIAYVGNDLWRMSNELDKLTAYSQQITAEEVDLLVNPQVEADIFAMIEAVARKDLKTAMKEFYRLLEAGEHELYILTMIIYQYRHLLVIKDLSQRLKSNNHWFLAKKSGLHPFVVQKSLAILPRYTLGDLKQIYHQLLNFDVQIKTGKIESRVALELLIFKLCQN